MRRTLVLFLLVSTIPFTVMAQLPEVGRIAIYADSMRTTSDIEELVPYTTFDFYIYCQSSENGMKCAEFALGSSTGSMVIVNTEWHDGISVKLGDLASGVSVCYHTCRPGWVSLVKVTLLNTIEEPSSIDIVRHPLVGHYQFANCTPEASIEAVFKGPGLCINSVCPPDTVPPAITGIVLEDASHLIVHFSEEIFEPDAGNLDNILLYTTDGSLDTIPVYFSRPLGEGDRVRMALESGLSGCPYKLEIVGLRDVTGNACAPGAGFEFSTDDIGPPELVSAHAPDESRVMLVFSEQLNEISAEEISNYTMGCNECAVVPGVASAVLEPDGITVRLGLDPPMGEFAEFEITVVGVSDASGNTISFPVSASFWPPDVFPPKITEVSVAADTALAVLWDEPIDLVSAEDPANYSFVKDGPPEEQMDLISAELVDSVSLRLNFATAMEVYQEYTLFVSGVMDTSMNTMMPDIISIEPPDTIPPVLISVICTGVRTVDLTFDEPINTAMTASTEYWPVFPIDYYEPRNILQITLYNDNKVVHLELANDLTAGAEYTACGIDIRDLAGNSIHMQCLDFICFDNSPPEIEEIFLPDLTHVNIRFDETVNDAAAETASYVLHEEADSTAIVAIDSVNLYDGDTRAVLTTAGALDLGEIYTLKMNGIGDLPGNMIDPDRSWSFAAIETVGPVLLGVTAPGDDIVYLAFDEPLDPVTAEDVSRYSVAEEGDSSIKLPLLSASLDSAGTTVALDIDGPVKTGVQYVVWIDGVTDISGNELYTVSSPFLFPDIYPPELLSVRSGSARQVRVDFNEAVSIASAEDTNNYTLYLAGDSSAGIEITDAVRRPDEMSAELSLGGDLVLGTGYTLEVTGITDLAGNTMEPDTINFDYIDALPPEISFVYLGNLTNLFIEFNEPVDSETARDAGNYVLYFDGSPFPPIIESIDWMGDAVLLHFEAWLPWNMNLSVVITGVEDLYGNACSGLSAEFFIDSSSPATMTLYADDHRGSQEIDPDPHDPFSIYLWIRPGEYGASGAEYVLTSMPGYAVRTPETFILSGVTLNPVHGSTAVGDPFTGHSITMSTCEYDWFWPVRIDCICLDHDFQEIVWPALYFTETNPYYYPIITTCLPGNPQEIVFRAYPVLLNPDYVETLLDSWDVSFRGDGIELNWSIMEIEKKPEFEVSRTLDGSESWQPLDAELIRGEGLEYTMIDSRLEFGLSYRYRVESVEDDGRKILFETDAIATPVMPLTMRQNSPNPFNPSTNISFYLPQSGHVRLEIFDVNGRLVDVLADAQFAGGEHSIDWDGRDRGGSSVSSGVYFYRLIADKESLSRKMVLMR